MDSGNSGSLQSSSGGDEEYDSRAADSIFMSSTPPPHIGPISNPSQPQLPPLFDPLISNYVQQLHQNPNPSLLNPNIPWPRSTTPLRSTTSHDIIIPSFPPPTAVGPDNTDPAAVGPASQNPNHATARNPKKRSRASRRAPTTVLTTDTTNFRAMVQEFTGIPAPPFNTSSIPRTRLDLFTTRSAALDVPPPPYLRRPFAQKVQSPPPFLASTTAIAAASTTDNNNNMSTSSAAISSSTTPINYQQPISQGFSNLFSINPNPLVSSLLQTNPKFLFSNSSAMPSSKPHFSEIPSNDIKIGGLDDQFGLGHGIPNLISSDQIAAHNDDRNDNNGVGPDEGGAYQAQIRAVNGGYNGKINYSASSSNSHGQKVIPPENINVTRGEGMMESWICSSE